MYHYHLTSETLRLVVLRILSINLAIEILELKKQVIKFVMELLQLLFQISIAFQRFMKLTSERVNLSHQLFNLLPKIVND